MLLQCGDVTVSLALDGARITASHRGRAFLRDCFAMVPLGNRVEGNCCEMGGQTYHFRPNTDEPFYLHGDGWLSPWQLAEVTATTARLVMEQAEPDASPHIYRAEMGVSLSLTALTVSLGVTNTGPDPMPFGLGLHPFLPRSDHTRLTAPANRFWSEGADFLPGCPGPIPATADFRDPRQLPAHRLNNAYEGWSGQALIQAPGLTLQMNADPVFAHLMVYAPEGEDFFCLEPMTHLPNALARQGVQSMHVLAFGQALSGQITFGLME